jgi:hypothetical protein
MNGTFVRRESRVEVGSNTSLRLVGEDEKGTQCLGL